MEKKPINKRTETKTEKRQEKERQRERVTVSRIKISQ
jgi:hypothetical protein